MTIRYSKHGYLLLFLLVGVAIARTAYAAPCIDISAESWAGARAYTFHRSDGTAIRRLDAVIEGFDAATNTLSVSEAGELLHSLRLTEWPSLDIALGEFESPAQELPPALQEILVLNNAKYPLASMKVSVLEGLLSYDDCVSFEENHKLLFQGTLLFDTANNSLTVDGRFYRISHAFGGPSGVSINPGIRK